MIVKIRLKKISDCEIVEADNGQSGIEIVRENLGKFNAVILDYNLPDMNGSDILSAIKALSPALPVIIATGKCHPKIALSLQESGADKVLEKPLEIAQIQEYL